MNFVTLGWVLGSIAFSTSIIMLNKHLMNGFGFDCPIFLTSFHFFMTWLFLEILCRFRFIERATTISTYDRWLVSGLGIAAVIFQNLNLLFNSVGFYQLSKLCCIPFMVLYKFFVEHQAIPGKILFSLVFLLIGIAMFTVNDVTFNALGTIIALVAIPTVSLTQIYTKTIQDKYAINGPALQHATAFPQFFLALISGFSFETYGKSNIFTYTFKPIIILLIVITGFFAVGCNACAFGLIGKTSAITFQVVGHVKTILIFVFGLVMFRNPQETVTMLIKKVIGLSISMVGVVLYTIYELQLKSIEKKEDNNPILNEKEETLGSDEEEEEFKQFPENDE